MKGQGTALKKHRVLWKLVSFCTSFQFLLSSAVFAVPTAPVEQTGEVTAPAAPSTQLRNGAALSKAEIREILSSNIPEAFGSVRETFQGKGDKLVIHIQDSHANYEAQTNSSKILDFLGQGKLKVRKRFIAVEGGVGEVDLRAFTVYPEKDLLRGIADYFLKEAVINGAEYHAIFSADKVPLRGIEDKGVYVANLNSFTTSHIAQEKLAEPLEYLEKTLNALRQKVYSGDLKALMDTSVGYAAGNVKFTEYCDFLGRLAAQLKVNVKPYESFSRVLRVMELEKKIQAPRVEQERAQLIQALQRKLVKEDLAEMVRQSLLFRTGRVSSGDFYAFMKALAQKNKIDMAAYPNFTAYVEVVEIHEGIDTARLFFECEQLDQELRGALFQNEEERTLSQMLKETSILRHLLSLQMTRDDLRYFNDHKDDIAVGGRILPFVTQLLGRYAVQESDGVWRMDLEKGPLHIQRNRLQAAAQIDQNLKPMEEFYKLALERDAILCGNVLRWMDELKTDVAIVPTGGFHTAGLVQRLKAKNISYMVITPRMTKGADDKIYLARMLDERLPFEQFMERVGTRLANPDYFSQLGTFPMLKADGTPVVVSSDAKSQRIAALVQFVYVGKLAQEFKKRGKTAAEISELIPRIVASTQGIRPLRVLAPDLKKDTVTIVFQISDKEIPVEISWAKFQQIQQGKSVEDILEMSVKEAYLEIVQKGNPILSLKFGPEREKVVALASSPNAAPVSQPQQQKIAVGAGTLAGVERPAATTAKPGNVVDLAARRNEALEKMKARAPAPAAPTDLMFLSRITKDAKTLKRIQQATQDQIAALKGLGVDLLQGKSEDQQNEFLSGIYQKAIDQIKNRPYFDSGAAKGTVGERVDEDTALFLEREVRFFLLLEAAKAKFGNNLVLILELGGTAGGEAYVLDVNADQSSDHDLEVVLRDGVDLREANTFFNAATRQAEGASAVKGLGPTTFFLFHSGNYAERKVDAFLQESQLGSVSEYGAALVQFYVAAVNTIHAGAESAEARELLEKSLKNAASASPVQAYEYGLVQHFAFKRHLQAKEGAHRLVKYALRAALAKMAFDTNALQRILDLQGEAKKAGKILSYSEAIFRVAQENYPADSPDLALIEAAYKTKAGLTTEAPSVEALERFITGTVRDLSFRPELKQKSEDLEILELQEALRPLFMQADARPIAISDQPFIRKGDNSDTVYMIVSGEAEAYDESGVLTTIKAGGILGEIGAYLGQPRSVNVKAKTNLLVVALSRDDFLKALKEKPLVNATIADLVAKRQLRSLAAEGSAVPAAITAAPGPIVSWNAVPPQLDLDSKVLGQIAQSRIIEDTLETLGVRGGKVASLRFESLGTGAGSAAYKVTVMLDNGATRDLVLKLTDGRQLFEYKQAATEALKGLGPEALRYASVPLKLVKVDDKLGLSTERFAGTKTVREEYRSNPNPAEQAKRVALSYFGFWQATGRKYFITDVKDNNLTARASEGQPDTIVDIDYMIRQSPTFGRNGRTLGVENVLSALVHGGARQGGAWEVVNADGAAAVEAWLINNLTQGGQAGENFIAGFAEGIAEATGEDKAAVAASVRRFGEEAVVAKLLDEQGVDILAQTVRMRQLGIEENPLADIDAKIVETRARGASDQALLQLRERVATLAGIEAPPLVSGPARGVPIASLPSASYAATPGIRGAAGLDVERRGSAAEQAYQGRKMQLRAAPITAGQIAALRAAGRLNAAGQKLLEALDNPGKPYTVLVAPQAGLGFDLEGANALLNPVYGQREFIITQGLLDAILNPSAEANPEAITVAAETIGHELREDVLFDRTLGALRDSGVDENTATALARIISHRASVLGETREAGTGISQRVAIQLRNSLQTAEGYQGVAALITNTQTALQELLTAVAQANLNPAQRQALDNALNQGLGVTVEQLIAKDQAQTQSLQRFAQAELSQLDNQVEIVLEDLKKSQGEFLTGGIAKVYTAPSGLARYLEAADALQRETRKYDPKDPRRGELAAFRNKFLAAALAKRADKGLVAMRKEANRVEIDLGGGKKVYVELLRNGGKNLTYKGFATSEESGNNPIFEAGEGYKRAVQAIAFRNVLDSPDLRDYLGKVDTFAGQLSVEILGDTYLLARDGANNLRLTRQDSRGLEVQVLSETQLKTLAAALAERQLAEIGKSLEQAAGDNKNFYLNRARDLLPALQVAAPAELARAKAQIEALASRPEAPVVPAVEAPVREITPAKAKPAGTGLLARLQQKRAASYAATPVLRGAAGLEVDRRGAAAERAYKGRREELKAAPISAEQITKLRTMGRLNPAGQKLLEALDNPKKPYTVLIAPQAGLGFDLEGANALLNPAYGQREFIITQGLLDAILNPSAAVNPEDITVAGETIGHELREDIIFDRTFIALFNAGVDENTAKALARIVSHRASVLGETREGNTGVPQRVAIQLRRSLQTAEGWQAAAGLIANTELALQELRTAVAQANLGTGQRQALDDALNKVVGVTVDGLIQRDQAQTASLGRFAQAELTELERQVDIVLGELKKSQAEFATADISLQYKAPVGLARYLEAADAVQRELTQYKAEDPARKELETYRDRFLAAALARRDEKGLLALRRQGSRIEIDLGGGKQIVVDILRDGGRNIAYQGFSSATERGSNPIFEAGELYRRTALEIGLQGILDRTDLRDFIGKVDTFGGRLTVDLLGETYFLARDNAGNLRLSRQDAGGRFQTVNLNDDQLRALAATITEKQLAEFGQRLANAQGESREFYLNSAREILPSLKIAAPEALAQAKAQLEEIAAIPAAATAAAPAREITPITPARPASGLSARLAAARQNRAASAYAKLPSVSAGAAGQALQAKDLEEGIWKALPEGVKAAVLDLMQSGIAVEIVQGSVEAGLERTETTARVSVDALLLSRYDDDLARALVSALQDTLPQEVKNARQAEKIAQRVGELLAAGNRKAAFGWIVAVAHLDSQKAIDLVNEIQGQLTKPEINSLLDMADESMEANRTAEIQRFLDAVTPGLEAAAVAQTAAPSFTVAQAVTTAYPTGPGTDRPTPESNQDSTHVDAALGLILVADGAGGMGDGEKASRLVRDTVQESITKEKLAAAKTKEDVEYLLQETLLEANERLTRAKNAGEITSKAATTASLALVWKDPATGTSYVIGVNVGDSAIVLRRADGQVKKLTQDDGVVQEPVGKKSGAELDVYFAHRRVITAAVAGKDLQFEEHQTFVEELQPGDILVAHSDGPGDNLGEELLKSTLSQATNAEEAVNLLVSKTLNIAKGIETHPIDKRYAKKDDISVVALAVPAAAVAQPAAPAGPVSVAAADTAAASAVLQFLRASGEISFPSGLSDVGSRSGQKLKVTVTEEDVRAVLDALLQEGISGFRSAPAVYASLIGVWAQTVAEARVTNALFAQRQKEMVKSIVARDLETVRRQFPKADPNSPLFLAAITVAVSKNGDIQKALYAKPERLAELSKTYSKTKDINSVIALAKEMTALKYLPVEGMEIRGRSETFALEQEIVIRLSRAEDPDETRSLFVKPEGRDTVRVTTKDGTVNILLTRALPPVRIGRSSENDIVLADGKVSGKHLTLALTPEGLQVTDLGSTNGTYAVSTAALQEMKERARAEKLGEALGFAAMEPAERNVYRAYANFLAGNGIQGVQSLASLNAEAERMAGVIEKKLLGTNQAGVLRLSPRERGRLILDALNAAPALEAVGLARGVTVMGPEQMNAEIQKVVETAGPQEFLVGEAIPGAIWKAEARARLGANLAKSPAEQAADFRALLDALRAGGDAEELATDKQSLAQALSLVAARSPELIPYILRIAVVGRADSAFLGFESLDNYFAAHPGRSTGSIYVARGLFDALKNNPGALAQLLAHEAQHVKDYADKVREFAGDEGKIEKYFAENRAQLEANADAAEAKIAQTPFLDRAVQRLALNMAITGLGIDARLTPSQIQALQELARAVFNANPNLQAGEVQFFLRTLLAEYKDIPVAQSNALKNLRNALLSRNNVQRPYLASKIPQWVNEWYRQTTNPELQRSNLALFIAQDALRERTRSLEQRVAARAEAKAPVSARAPSVAAPAAGLAVGNVAGTAARRQVPVRTLNLKLDGRTLGSVAELIEYLKSRVDTSDNPAKDWQKLQMEILAPLYQRGIEGSGSVQERINEAENKAIIAALDAHVVARRALQREALLETLTPEHVQDFLTNLLATHPELFAGVLPREGGEQRAAAADLQRLVQAAPQLALAKLVAVNPDSGALVRALNASRLRAPQLNDALRAQIDILYERQNASRGAELVELYQDTGLTALWGYLSFEFQSVEGYEDVVVALRDLAKADPETRAKMLAKDANLATTVAMALQGDFSNPARRANLLNVLRNEIIARSGANNQNFARETAQKLFAQKEDKELGNDLHAAFTIRTDENGNILAYEAKPQKGNVKSMFAEEGLWIGHDIADTPENIAKIQEMIAKTTGKPPAVDRIFARNVGKNLSAKQAFLAQAYDRIKKVAEAKGKKVVSNRQVFIVTTPENFADIYQYAQAAGDYVVGVLAADGSFQVTSRMITALQEILGPEAFKGLDITLGDTKLVPKSSISILDDVISAKSAEIKA